MTYESWKRSWKNSNNGQRLGQAFVCDFIKGNWPNLFYETNDDHAEQLIRIWLTDIQVYPNVPEKVDPEYQSVRLPFIYGN